MRPASVFWRGCRCLGPTGATWLLRPPARAWEAAAAAARLAARPEAGASRRRLAASRVLPEGAVERGDLLRLLADGTGTGAGHRPTGSQTVPEFVPSFAWQRVPEGAVLEPGLQVRMDLAGGGSYARIPPAAHGVPAAKLTQNEVDDSTGAGGRVSLAAVGSQAGGEQARGPLEWGCKVRVSEDVDKVRRLSRRNWESAMEGFCGQTGTVTHIDSGGRVSVEFACGGSWTSWTYEPEALTMVGPP